MIPFTNRHYFCILLVLLSACKKEKLKDERTILIGEWEWVSTEKIIDYCDPDYMYTEFLSPITEQTTFQIKLSEKGYVHFFQKNEIIEKYRVVFDVFEQEDSNLDSTYFYFAIALNNNSELDFDGYVNSDSLIVVRDFPHPDLEVSEPGPECYLTTSFFVRK